MIRTPARYRVLALLASTAVLIPAGSALAQTADEDLNPSPVVTEEQPLVPASINASSGLVDYGQRFELRVFGRNGADVQLFGNGKLIREDTLEPWEDTTTGIAAWELQPGDRTLFHAVVEGQRTETITVEVRRTVSIGISQASGIYTFSGQVARAEAGLQVTVARLDSQTKRVTGVASTSTDAAGRYTIRTGLPAGFAGYYALTGVTGAQLQPGRSRLYGLVVPARVVVQPQQPTLTTPTVTIGVRAGGGDRYTLSGRVTPGRSVPVTLGEIRSERLVGITGGRASSNGSYSFTVTLNREARQTTRTFQVLTGAGQGLRAASSRPYGIVVPARVVVVNPAAETVSQRNARLSGKNYLEFTSFSRTGLIKQLQFEGYSTADATYGADAQRANWSLQAARSARTYLEFASFSRSGLIDQLIFDGYTRAEAEYGVRQVGL